MKNSVENNHNKLTRRNILSGTLRYGLLAAIGAGGVAIGLKRRRLLSEGKCLNRGVCAQCEVLSECGLPRARSVKNKPSEG